jgi:Pvc16 N-terminal domain
MFDEDDRRLATWIGGILDQVDVSLAPPGDAEGAKGVGLYLLEVVQSPPARGTRRPPLMMTLRYLVTTQAPKTEEAHEMLGRLLVAALQNPEFEVEQETLPLSLWTALGVRPRPSFVLRVPFKYDLPEKLAPRVRKPIIIKQMPLHSFQGRILGPENIPLMNARVELPAYEMSTDTDSKGRFHFSAVPATPGKRLLRVWAKGQEFSINTEQAGSDEDPLVIHLQLEG